MLDTDDVAIKTVSLVICVFRRVRNIAKSDY